MREKDYCTCAPDNFLGLYVGDACKVHDEHYQTGVPRREADIQFRINITSKGGVRAFFCGWIYFFGVRLFGWAFYESDE